MRAIPPPPPSSRPKAVGSADARAGLAERNGSPEAVETSELTPSQAPVPDSLVPVRIADLLDGPPSETGAVQRPRKLTVPVIGAFVVGAAVVFVVESFLTRTEHADTTHAIIAARPIAVADSDRASPARPFESSARAAFAAVPVVPSASALDAVPSAPPAASADPTKLPVESRTTSTTETDREVRVPAPVASSSASAVDPNAEQPAHRKLRKRRSAGSLAPEPPTAVFPD